MNKQSIVQPPQEFILEVLKYAEMTSVNAASKKYDIPRRRINLWRGKPDKVSKRIKRSDPTLLEQSGIHKPKNFYTEEFKQKVLEYEKTHTQQETCDLFEISRYSIQKWKGWIRTNAKDSNKKWYANKGKDYYSREDIKEIVGQQKKEFFLRNPGYYARASKKHSHKCRFKKLVEYANRTFANKKVENFHRLEAWDLWKIAKKQRLICPLTGIKLDASNMSVDHIVPISKGGTNHPSNIRLVQKWVNIMLQDKTDEEFLLMCQTIINYQLSVNSSTN